MLPAIVFIVLLTIVPILSTVTFSTFQYEVTRPDELHFNGLKNFVDLASDERFHNSLKVMLILITIPVAVQLLLGFALALALNERLAGTNWMRIFFLAPAVMPPIVIGLVWKIFVIPDHGGLAYFLGWFGLSSPALLGSPFGAVSVIVAAVVWTGTPFTTLMFLSAIESIPASYYEAASIDGASWWQTHRIVTLPLVSSVTKTLLIFRALEALGIFPVIFVLTGGGPANATEPINFYAYKTGFDYFNLDYAAAIIVVFFVILMAVTYPFLRSVARVRK